MKLIKVISGGQTGVDQAALRAARTCGIKTGGWAPRNWMTLSGPQRDMLQGFGLSEHSEGYAARTDANVRDSDATIRIASDFKSAGEKLTKLCTLRHSKPRCDFLVIGGDINTNEYFQGLRAFLITHDVRVLNVAGNSEQTSPGIGSVAEKFLLSVFRSLQ
jgi:hypothetical protein